MDQRCHCQRRHRRPLSSVSVRTEHRLFRPGDCSDVEARELEWPITRFTGWITVLVGIGTSWVFSVLVLEDVLAF